MKKTSLLFILIAALGTCYAPSSWAKSGVSLSIGGEAVSVGYLIESDDRTDGGTDYGLGLLYNESYDYLFSAQGSILGRQDSEQRAWRYGIGAKVYYGDGSSSHRLTTSNIAIGGQVHYLIPSSVAPKTLVFSLYAAPSITSFSDSESLHELSLELQFDIANEAYAYLGYRLLHVEFTNNTSVDYDNSLFVGIRLPLS